MALRLPEHTVDTWLGIEIQIAMPLAHIWAPSTRADPSWDVGAALPGRKTAIFECKGTVVREGSGEHRLPIDIDQLIAYALPPRGGLNALGRLFYMLPCPPWNGIGTTPSGWTVPALAQWRFSPEPFRDWAWVVPSISILNYLHSNSLLHQSHHDLDPADVPSLPQAMTLSRFLCEFRQCNVGIEDTKDLYKEPLATPPELSGDELARFRDEKAESRRRRLEDESNRIRRLVGMSIELADRET